MRTALPACIALLVRIALPVRGAFAPRIALAVGIAFAAGIALVIVPLCVMAGEPPHARQSELLHMLRHDCGACHGLRLDGGLGPPLTPEALAGVVPAVLERVILEGRPGTPMPPWRALLSPAEVRWMVHAIRSGRTGE